MSTASRRFLTPWSVHELERAFVVADATDAAAVARRRERLAHEVAGQCGDRPFDILEVPLRDFPALATIDRVDPDKRRLVRRQA